MKRLERRHRLLGRCHACWSHLIDGLHLLICSGHNLSSQSLSCPCRCRRQDLLRGRRQQRLLTSHLGLIVHAQNERDHEAAPKDPSRHCCSHLRRQMQQPQEQLQQSSSATGTKKDSFAFTVTSCILNREAYSIEASGLRAKRTPSSGPCGRPSAMTHDRENTTSSKSPRRLLRDDMSPRG